MSNDSKNDLQKMNRIDAIWYHGLPATITQMKNIIRRRYSNQAAREWCIWIIGESGIGKNHLIEQAAEELSEEHEEKVELLWFPCKGLAPEDIRGIPKLVRYLKDGDYSNDISGAMEMAKDYFSEEPSYKFQQVEYLRKAFDPEWKGIIHFDEFPQASKEVQEMLYMFFYDRRMDDQYLSPGAMVIASMNPPAVGDYMLSKMSKAAQDRPSLFKIEPSAKEWIEWAKSRNINPTVVDFVTEHPGVYDRNKGRALKRFADIVGTFGDLDPNNIPPEFKMEAYSNIDIESADRFAKYIKDIFEISGSAILSGNKNQFKKLTKMMQSEGKTVQLYRVQQEIIRSIGDPETYLKETWSKAKNEDAAWDDVAGNLVKYMDILKDTDMDSVVGLLKELTKIGATKAEKKVNELLRDKKNEKLLKEVIRCLRVNTGSSTQTTTGDSEEKVMAAS